MGNGPVQTIGMIVSGGDFERTLTVNDGDTWKEMDTGDKEVIASFVHEAKVGVLTSGTQRYYDIRGFSDSNGIGTWSYEHGITAHLVGEGAILYYTDSCVFVDNNGKSVHKDTGYTVHVSGSIYAPVGSGDPPGGG